MPCHGCTSKFGLLTKEYGCPSCGFSFCSSCLKNKIPLPKLDNKEVKVCKSCFNNASHESTTTEMDRKQHFNPPDIFLRRLETLDTPPNPPITIYHDKPSLQQLLTGLSSTDLEIALRLKKLRDERRKARHVPTEEEIASRLAKLRDQDSNQASRSSSSGYLPPDVRSGVEQADDLMKQTVEAAEIDSRHLKPEEDIAERLKRLRNKYDVSQTRALEDRGGDSANITLDEVAELLAQCKMEAGEGGTRPDLATIVSLEQLRTRLTKHKDYLEQEATSDDENTAVQRIIAKAAAEVELEKRLGVCDDGSDEMDEDAGNEGELPWCVICNENATVRCLGCDNDIYCKDCFEQGHKDADMHDHVREAFRPK